VTVLFFDPVGGAAGDMILASLIDLGCPVGYLNETLSGLGLDEARGHDIVRIKESSHNGIRTLNLSFDIDQPGTPERDFAAIKKIIGASTLPEPVRRRSIAVFEILAAAEGAVHGCDPEKVHFHEVGAADSILDITGIAAAVEWFSPDACFCGPLPLGTGTVTSRHGVIPVPAPATVKIAEGMAARFTGIHSELTTPTAAAVLKHLCSGTAPSDLVINKTGYGAGSRTIPSWPNMFRTMHCGLPHSGETVYIVEADVDDMNPEDLEPAIEALNTAGALDVNLTQRIMKRGRPGTGIRAFAEGASLEKILDALLRHTSSIGARFYPVRRRVLERKEYTVKLDVGEITVKEALLPDGTRRIKPEFRELYALSRQTGIPMDRLRQFILKKTGGAE